MEGRHWRTHEIVAHYYGLVAPSDVHGWEECSTCSGLWHEFEQRRKDVITAPPVSRERLADIRAGLERKRDLRGWRRWYLTSAIAVTLCITILVTVRPAPKPLQAQALEEILAEAVRIEPSSVAAAQMLFQEETK